MLGHDRPTPISIKGVIRGPRGVLLLRNSREEWELPGGRPDGDESPMQTLEREVYEELGLSIAVGGYVDSWLYHIVSAGVFVQIETYACRARDFQSMAISAEHVAADFFDPDVLDTIRIPSGYVTSIRKAFHAGLV